MRLWTIQPIPWWNVLRSRGRLTGWWARIDPDHEHAYRWMAREMVDRGIDLSDASPVWGWHSYGGRGRRPDMRVLRERTPVVRVELDVPDHLVLLSDHEAWHYVLNNWYLALTDAELTRAHRLQDAGRLSAAEIERTWGRIFDLDGLTNFVTTPGQYVQACLPCVRSEWVRKVERFKAR